MAATQSFEQTSAYVSLMMDIVELTTTQIYPARQRSAFPRRLAILEDPAHGDELGGETALH